MGEVLVMAPGIGFELGQLGFEREGLVPPQLQEELDPAHARQLGGPSRREPAQLVELDRRENLQFLRERNLIRLLGEKDLLRNVDDDCARGDCSRSPDGDSLSESPSPFDSLDGSTLERDLRSPPQPVHNSVHIRWEARRRPGEGSARSIRGVDTGSRFFAWAPLSRDNGSPDPTARAALESRSEGEARHVSASRTRP